MNYFHLVVIVIKLLLKQSNCKCNFESNLPMYGASLCRKAIWFYVRCLVQDCQDCELFLFFFIVEYFLSWWHGRRKGADLPRSREPHLDPWTAARGSRAAVWPFAIMLTFDCCFLPGFVYHSVQLHTSVVTGTAEAPARFRTLIIDTLSGLSN